jgi:hypothetical protein
MNRVMKPSSPSIDWMSPDRIASYTCSGQQIRHSDGDDRPTQVRIPSRRSACYLTRAYEIVSFPKPEIAR